MDILILFKKIKNKKDKTNLKNTVYKYSNIYTNNSQFIEILSDKELSDKEVESLGKIYFSNNDILKKGYIDLVVDKYIINNNI